MRAPDPQVNNATARSPRDRALVTTPPPEQSDPAAPVTRRTALSRATALGILPWADRQAATSEPRNRQRPRQPLGDQLSAPTLALEPNGGTTASSPGKIAHDPARDACFPHRHRRSQPQAITDMRQPRMLHHGCGSRSLACSRRDPRRLANAPRCCLRDAVSVDVCIVVIAQLDEFKQCRGEFWCLVGERESGQPGADT